MKAAGLTPDVWAYAAVIEAHRASGLAAAAEAVYREMGNDGVAPNVACFNALLRVYNVAGKLEVRAIRFPWLSALRKERESTIGYMPLN